jgi:hypothetical protein
MKNKLHDKLVRKPAAKNAKQKPVPVKIISDSPSPMSSDDKWRAQDALRTLQRAEEIKRDKSLMKAAKAEARSQMKQLSTVCK